VSKWETRIIQKYNSIRGAEETAGCVMENSNTERRLHTGLGALQAFIGLGALAGGFGLVNDPSGGALGLPLSLLEGSPFQDYLIPGLFLMVVNGMGSMIGAAFSFTRRRYAPETAMVLGAILVAWIVIQVIVISSFHWLHVLYFILGVVELVFGLYIRGRRTRGA
jgi:hypothetical protein